MTPFPPDIPLTLWTMAVAAVCNVTCAVLGCYLVLRRLSLVGDAISHAVLPGLAFAFLVSGQLTGWPVFLGAMLMGVLTVFLTDTVQRLTGAPEDASLGVVFTALFALGVILITRLASQVDLDPGCILYGLIEFTAVDTVPVAGLGVPRVLLTLVPTLFITLAFILLLWKELKLSAFDPGLATAMGFPAGLLHYLLMALVAGVTVSSFEAVGSILVIAMLIVPGATAHLLSDRLGWMMAWSAAVAVLSAVLGTLWATYLNTSVAGMMAVVAGLQFLLAVFLAPRHGLLSRALRTARLRLRIVREDILGHLYRLEEESRPAKVGDAWEPGGTPIPPLAPGSTGVVGLLARWALRRCGLVQDGSGSSLVLTDAGRTVGASLVRAHRLWESYLRNELDLPLDHLHDPAEAMEHFLNLELQNRLLEELRQPTEDPHGKAIPPLR